MDRKGTEKIFNTGVIVLASIYLIITVLPLIHVLANSFSSAQAVNAGKVGLFPVEFTFDSYILVLKNPDIIRGFINTIIYTSVGTVLQLVLQFTAAYALTRKNLKYKSFWNIFFVVPLFVSGGLIPSYLVVKELGMLNTIWAMIIPGVVNLFNLIIIRTFINTTIPYEVQ